MLEFLSAFSQRGDLVFLVMIFLSIVLLTLVVLTYFTNAIDVRRRAQALASGGARGPSVAASLNANAREEAGLLEGFLPSDEASRSELRRFLALAGYDSRSALAIYQLIRLGTAVFLGFVTVLKFSQVMPGASFLMTAIVGMLMTILGYYLPKTFVSMRRDSVCQAHRDGFPDFLDLMVICTDAGIGVDAAIDRVSKELVTAHPSLARNLRIMSLELRAGRSLRDALDNLADRLGIPEAKSFATLIQQSEELGSSLVDSLKVYSEEMRAKRYARAEEKAYGLPAKLVIPLGLCVFPVILGVTLVPVVIKIYKAFGI
jgi:tight adherence protein C